MNAYRFNGMAGWIARLAITTGLRIPSHAIYKEVVDILSDGKILTKSGKVYVLTLTEVKNDQGNNQQ